MKQHLSGSGLVRTTASTYLSHARLRRHATLVKSCRKRFIINARITSSAAPKLKEFGFATDFADRFYLGDHLGTGSFGSVHIAVEKRSGERYAVKTIKKKFVGGWLEPNLARRVQHEVDICNTLSGSLNVASMYGAYEDEKCVDLVMELCTGGELWQRIRRGKYTERSAAAIIREVLRTIAQCHAKGIIIRDVKPDNFLFLNSGPDSPLKMIDFGLASYCTTEQQLTERAGTPFYVAPEVLTQRYGQKADVWSAGIVAYELLAGRLPFEMDGELLTPDLLLSQHSISNRDVFNSIIAGDLDFRRPPWSSGASGASRGEGSVSAAAQRFVQKLLTRDPAQRPTAAEALNHPWLAASSPTDVTTTTTSTVVLSSSTSNGYGNTAPDASAVQAGLTDSVQGNGAASSGSSAGASNGVQAAGEGSASVGGPGSQDEMAPLSDTIVQRLQRFGTYSKLKQVALRRVAAFLAHDPERVGALHAAFREVDPQGTGTVPYAKVVELLSSDRFDLSDVEVTQLLGQFEIDAEGMVDYSQWVAALLDWRAVQDSKEWDAWVQRVFDLFDQSHTGRLTTSELEAMLCDEDEGCPIPDTVPAALRQVGHFEEPSGASISFDEFRRMLREAAADRLDLFQSRRVQRVEAGSDS